MIDGYVCLLGKEATRAFDAFGNRRGDADFEAQRLVTHDIYLVGQIPNE